MTRLTLGSLGLGFTFSPLPPFPCNPPLPSSHDEIYTSTLPFNPKQEVIWQQEFASAEKKKERQLGVGVRFFTYSRSRGQRCTFSVIAELHLISF